MKMGPCSSRSPAPRRPKRSFLWTRKVLVGGDNLRNDDGFRRSAQQLILKTAESAGIGLPLQKLNVIATHLNLPALGAALQTKGHVRARHAVIQLPQPVRGAALVRSAVEDVLIQRADESVVAAAVAIEVLGRAKHGGLSEIQAAPAGQVLFERGLTARIGRPLEEALIESGDHVVEVFRRRLD